jgi:hypothetical protein
VVVESPDILIVEGLNVLQPARLPRDGAAIPFVSDFFDFSVYLDADEEDLHRWYLARFLRLRSTAFRNPLSYFRKYADLSEAEADRVRRGALEPHQPREPERQHSPNSPAREPDPAQGRQPPDRTGFAAAALKASVGKSRSASKRAALARPALVRHAGHEATR